ncbi:Kinesin motor domain [Phytophthora infestans]|uniref:Kinesin motor domain n=1 Tax=Phytophthora infestans TaxID=4787 RepID=A0A8S9U5E4_PHYIN|nr:Kinesin motor domain [Phytophthora infestans]
MDASNANVKVFCRVRPPNERERGVNPSTFSSGSAGFLARSSAAAASTSFAKKCVTVPASDGTQQTVFLHSKHGPSRTFTFDRVFGEDACQNDVFEVVGAPITRACLEGYNGTIFAYGQTGSGKTFTMQGPDDVIDTEAQSLTREQLALRGLVPRVFDYLFDNVVAKDSRKNVQHTFACSFLEIYNERVYDLLDGGSAKDAAGLQLRENGRKGVHVEGLIESVVANSKKAAELMTVGAQNRRVGQTSMNRESSRSHSVFILQLQSKEMTAEGTKIRTSRFNLVDLAGSERQRSTDAAGERLKEAGSINKSLSALGNVIMGLSEQSVGKHRHVHYRDSKLTFLLKDSLGGNSKTFMVATISPAEDSSFETLSTLKFAQRAKMIQNSAVVNEDSVGSALFLQEEILRLKRQLQQAHQEIARNIPGSSVLQQGATPFESASSQDSFAPSSRQLGPCDPAIDSRFRELEESFATTAEKSDRLQRSCEFLQLQNGHSQALCTELKQHVAHLKMMLRLRGIGGPGAHEYKPTADAIEWRMKYEEMEERFVELQDELQRSGMEDAGATGKINSEVESLNLMLLGLTKQLAFVLRDKHDLQDRLLENQSDKGDNREGPSTQEVGHADFSARLEEALRQQASEYQAKLDSVASFNQCLEEKAADTSLELQQMKQREASWSIQRHDLERQLVDSRGALLSAEKAHCSTKSLLIQEKSKVEDLEMKLKRVQEGIRLEFDAALADASTANEGLENSKMLLQEQLSAVAAELNKRELQAQEAEHAFVQLKKEMAHLEEANLKTVMQLGEARDELKEATQQAAHLRARVGDCEKTIDVLKRAEAAVTEERTILEQKLEESINCIRQLQEDANATAQKHSEAIEALQRQAQEEEHKLAEDFETRLRVRDEQLQQLHDEFDDHRAKAEEADRLHSSKLEDKEAALAELQRQLDAQEQESRQALEDAQMKLSKALDDASRLSEEKSQVDAELSLAAQQLGRLQADVKELETEKKAMASETERLSERTEELAVKASELDEQNTDLKKTRELQQAQLSESEETISKFRQQVGELEQQITTRSNEAADLRKGLASAQEDLCQAANTQAQQVDELSCRATKIAELEKEIAASKDTVEHLTTRLEKAEGEIRAAEGTASHQREEIMMYKGIQSTLRDELKGLEFDRLELAESLKTEQESKQGLEEKFAEAREAWAGEKKKIAEQAQESILALEKRVEELVLSKEALSTSRHELEQNNEALKASAVEKDRKVQELSGRVADRDDKILDLEASTAETQGQLAGTVAELRSAVRDLELQSAEQQSALSKQETELAEKEAALAERDDAIVSLKERASRDEAAWDVKAREYKAALEATDGRVQALEQLVAEKTAVFAKAKEALVAETHSLEQKLEEGEEILAQQTEQLMLEIKQLEANIEGKDAKLQLANRSLIQLKDTEDDRRAKVQELQIALEELEAKHNSVVAENTKLKQKAVAELKEQEEELKRRRREIDAAEEHSKSVQKALEAQQAAAESALKEAKAKAVTLDELGQAKRKFLSEKVRLQREIQSLTKKLETVSNEKEKLVGHHNSRQKIQHHVKVKEENNRLLDQVRQLTDDKAKLQRSLERFRAIPKEKENIGVESSRNTPASVSPGSSTSSKSLPTKRPSLGSASSATASTEASAARAAARLTTRGRPRSASPGPMKKRVRTHSSGPGWQR